MWATNFDTDVNVITRHTSDPTAPYTNASRRLSTLRTKAGSIYPIDQNVESIAFDNAQNMYVGHSFGYANNNGDPADINDKAVWMDDNFTLAARFNAATSYYVDWNRYKTTASPTPGTLYDDGGTVVSTSYPYPAITTTLWNEAKTTWTTLLTADWNVRKQEGAGLITVDAAGAALLSAGNNYIPWDQAVSPDGFYESWTGLVATYLRTSGGAKIALREQAGMDIHKYPVGTTGYGKNLAGFPTTYSNVRYGATGADALDLMADQQTMIYSSENQYLYRFNVATGVQQPVVGSTVLSSGAALTDVSHPITDVPIYGVRVLPPGDGTGGYLVGTEAQILRLDRNGLIIQTYDAVDAAYSGGTADGWFSLAVTPDGRSFWAATRQDVYRFDIASGAVLGSRIHATDGVAHTSTVVDGLCVMNEYRAARENCGVNGLGNGLDDDGDGVIDNGCFRIEICSITSPGDDDGNGLVDYNDPACYAPGEQPPTATCATSGPTDPSVAGFCARQNAEGDSVNIAAVPLPCSGVACDTWTFSYVATGLPPGLTMNSVTGQITGTPAYAIVANLITAPPVVYNVAVTGTWTQTGQLPATVSSAFTWTITNTNRPPVAVNDTARAQSGSTVLINVMANDTDPDAGDVKSIIAGSLTTPMNASLQPTGTVSVVSGQLQYAAPAGTSGVVTFFYQIQDNYGVPGVSNQGQVTVTINGAPVARDDSYTMTGGTSLTVNAANGIIQNAAGRDTDPENTTLTVASSTAPSHGSVTVNADGSFTYTPVVGYTGTDTFTYKVTDGEAQSNTATVTIVVPAPPVAVNDSFSTQKNVVLTVGAAWNGLLYNDSDPRGLPITVFSFTNPSHGALSMSAANDGTFTYTPVNNYVGTDTFTYRVTNGSYQSNVATVTISIVTANNPPVAVNDSYVVNAGSTLTVAGGNLLLNDSDPDRDLMAAALVSSPSQAGAFTFTAGSGAFTYTPAVGVTGNVTFTYKVSDPYGLSSNTATVTIRVNALPVAVNDSYTTAEDTVLTVPVAGILANDTDADAGSTLTAVLPLVSLPTHGTVTQNANGSLVYTPVLNYNGTDSYTYRVQDELGALSANVATVTITITPVNDLPVAVADSYSVLQGNTLAITNAAQGFIQRNDTDVDDNVTALTATMVSTVGHGSLVFGLDGTFTYVPTTGFSGTDTFTYFVRDSKGGVSNTVTVTITVIPTSMTATATPVCATNAAFVDYTLAPVNYTFPVGTTAQIDWIDSSSRIVRTDTNQPISGRVVWPGTVIVAGLPVDWPGWLLSGVLWIEGVDGFELTKPAVTMRFTVASKVREVSVAYPAAITGCSANPPLNLAPIAANDSYVTSMNTALTVPATGILTNDRDPEGGALTVNLPLNTTPQHGTVTQNADGSLVYTPTTGYFGVDTYAYRAKDAGGLVSNLATVSIMILGPTTATVPNVTVTYDGLSHGTSCAILGGDGTALPGTLTYVPALSVHVGTYTATCAFAGDGRYLSASATGTVRINPAPLTITATPLSKVYGTAVTPVFTSSGLASTDSISAVTLTTVGAVATAPVAGSPYAIVPSAVVGTNLTDYTINYVNGAITVTKAPLTITANSTSKVSGTVVTFVGTEFTAGGLINGDTVTSAMLTSTGAASSAAAGSYPIVPSAAVGTGLANYAITYVNGTLTVTQANRPPVAVNDAVTAFANFATSIPVISNDSDPDGDALVVTANTAPAHGTVTRVGNVFSYTPTVGYTGTDTFTYTISDGRGGVATATVTITVSGCEPGASTTFTQGGWGSSPSGSNPGALLASKFLTVYPAGSVQIGGGRTLTFTSVAAIDAFLPQGGAPNKLQYTVVNPTSSKGGVFAGQVLALQLNVDFSTARVTKGGLAAKVLASGKLAGYTVGQVLAIANGVLGGTLPPTNVSISDLNGIVDAINQNFDNGTADRGYLLADAACAAQNRAPVAVNDGYSTLKNTRLTISAPGVKTNDSDPDQDVITAQIVATTTHGALTFNADGSFSYLPATNYVGSDSFTYRVKDASGLNSNVATVTITITSVVCSLSANDDTYATNKNHALVLKAEGGVLANDADPFDRGITVTEVNGSSYKVGSTTSTAHGTVKVNADGSLIYTPASNYAGSDSLTYKIRSAYNNSVSASATVSIMVTAHYDGDGCDHDRRASGHQDGDHCSHDKAMDRHYAGDGCDHDRKRNGHHEGDGCGHDNDLHRHRDGDLCDHELGQNGHYNGDQCDHELSDPTHYDGDGCSHERYSWYSWWHYAGDGCDHEKQTTHHNDGDDCDHERGANGHNEGDGCAHEREGHGHGAGDGCDHDRKVNGHSDGDRCEHDEHRGDASSDDNACVANETDHHHYGDSDDHHSGDNDDQGGGHHSGDYCDHDRKKNGHKDGDGCDHDRITKHTKGDTCDHDRRINGHKEGDHCDHDRADRDDRHDRHRGDGNDAAPVALLPAAIVEDRRD